MMSTALNVIFMLAIPLGFAGIIALVLLSGSMSPARRRWIEGLMMAVFYPGMTAFFTYLAVDAVMERDWLAFAARLVVALMNVLQGVILFRKRVRADGTRT